MSDDLLHRPRPLDPHLRIVSGGDGRDTHLVFVDDAGQMHTLPGCMHITWSVDPTNRAFASVVFSKVRIDAVAMEGVYELLDSLTGLEARDRSSGRQSGRIREGALTPERTPQRPPAPARVVPIDGSYGGSE